MLAIWIVKVENKVRVLGGGTSHHFCFICGGTMVDADIALWQGCIV